MKKNFNGIFTALLTPFDSNGNIDEEQLSRLIEFNLNKGVDGFYVDGSTAESFLMSIDERKQLLSTVADIVARRCTLIAQVGCISTLHSVKLARYCESLGYDAISSVAPFYYKFSFDEIRSYYFELAAAVDIPLFIYNIPALSGVTLSVDNICELLKNERILGVKFTSGDFFALERIKAAFPNKIIFNGYDEMMLAGLVMGADGGIGSTYNFMADKFVALKKSFDAGDIRAAQEMQSEINSIIAALVKVGVMQGEKYVLDCLGIKAGQCRGPFAPLTDEQKKYLDETILPLV